MGSFWTLARRMLRYRRRLVMAIAMAALSATGLGVGIMALVPVLENILSPDAEDLRTMARRWSGWLNERVGVSVPEGWINVMPTERFDAVLTIVLALGVLTVIGAGANFLHAYFSLTVVSRSIADIRRESFRKVLHLPLRTVVRSGPSDFVSRVVYDTTTLGSGFSALLSKGVAQVSKGAASLIAAFVVNWKLALVACLVAPVLGVVIRKTGTRIRRASRQALSGQAGLYQTASETLMGLRVVKVYTRERAESGRFHKISKSVVKQEMRVRTARALASPLVESMAVFVLGGLSLVAARAIITGDLDPASFIATVGALGVAGTSLKPLTGIISDIQQAGAAADRVHELLEMPSEPGFGRKLARLGRHRSSIEFESVSFAYPGAEAPALREVTLRIAQGETVAVVGPNGSGKTTLLSLIPRLFDPTAGRVMIDGQDIREFSVRSVREQVGVVTQEVVLFAGTIASNIAYGSDHPTEELIRDAARRARAEEFILQKPLGYDEPVAEQGASLSGGQRQRISIARAIIRDPAILILDEATSMIDADSEARIAEALADFSRGRTCLIVAHRLSTVMNADRIVVMDGGRIVATGRHEELLRTSPVYRLIAEHQLVKRGVADAGEGEGPKVPVGVPGRASGPARI